MHMNFQTKEDIQRVILDSMIAIGHPASEHEVALWVWNRCLVDGVRSGVYMTVFLEMRHLFSKGVLTRRTFQKDADGPYYEVCVLDAIVANL